MNGLAILLLSVAVITGSSARAGVCSDAIASMQARLDARLEGAAAAGHAGLESAAALEHRQPTPNSIAAAEERLGELSPETIESVRAAMARARGADAMGDKEACERALEEAQAALGR